MSDEITTETTTTEVEGAEPKFTQVDIDRLIAKARSEEKRKATEKFADYDDLKSKAEGAKTLEQQFAELKSELVSTKTEALRARVAADYGISTKRGPNDEPSDADLFLTGTDEATLNAQAERLAGREADRKKNGNTAPKEGGTKTTGKGDEAQREFVRGLFGQSD